VSLEYFLAELGALESLLDSFSPGSVTVSESVRVRADFGGSEPLRADKGAFGSEFLRGDGNIFGTSGKTKLQSSGRELLIFDVSTFSGALGLNFRGLGMGRALLR